MSISFNPKQIKFGTITSVQNYLRYSEVLDNAVWTHGNVTITNNSAVDTLGNTTMERLTFNSAWAAFGQGLVTGFVTTLTQGATYYFSFDIKRGTQASSIYYEVYDDTNNASITGAVNIHPYTSETVQRLSYSFVVPVGCISQSFIFMGAVAGDNWYVGRIQVAQAGKGYVTTTSTQVI